MREEIDNMIAADRLLTVAELASRLSVKRSWIYTHADDLGAYRLGKYLRFSWPRVVHTLEQSAITTSKVDPAVKNREECPAHCEA